MVTVAYSFLSLCYLHQIEKVAPMVVERMFPGFQPVIRCPSRQEHELNLRTELVGLKIKYCNVTSVTTPNTHT